MGLRGFERRLENLVEGAFARAFRSGLRPVEIGRRITKVMDDRRTIGVDGGLISPNRFEVALATADHDQLAGISESLQRELAESARGHARDAGYRFLGPVTVQFAESPRLKLGTFRIQAELVEQPGGAGAGSLVLEDRSRVELGTDTTVIGRLPECTIQLTDSSVSRRHAELRPTEGGWVIADLDSMNGTTVNGDPIGERRLNDSDVIGIGQHRIRFEAS